MFMQAYVYENSLQDYGKAKTVYTEFIRKYPESELVEDARISIRNLGKSPEEILESLLKKDSIS
jgi:outer membrane protein assembly factor BamD (BamD/ComL family)